MAFGKDKSVLGQVANRSTANSFRQSAAQTQANRTSRGSGGRIPYWLNKYQPSKHALDTIRVILGEYEFEEVDQSGDLLKKKEPYFPYTEHFSKRHNAGAICSAGPFGRFKNKANPCVGCSEFFAGMTTDEKGKKQKGYMSKRDLIALTILDYAPYHKTPQVNNDGSVRANDSGQPYYNWTKCEGRGCEGCGQQLEVKQGHRLHWSMGTAHWNTLMDANELIGASCVGCGSKDCITCLAWLCSGCGEALIDMSTTSYKDEEINKMTRKPMRCASCKKEDFPQEFIECSNCTPAGRTPTRATVFDVDIKVKRVEDPNGGNQTTLSISSWSEPRPVDKQYVEMAKPMKLDEIFAPTPLADQEEKFQIRKPVTGGSRPYGQPQG